MANIPPASVAIVEKWEGCQLKVYRDPAGIPTVAWGHRLTFAELASGVILVPQTCALTQDQADAMLLRDMSIAATAVDTSLGNTLSSNQRAALISFVYNIGVTAYYKSAVLRDITRRAFTDVPTQMKRWVFSKGKKYQGLVNRRNDEANLWNGVGQK